MNTLLELIPIGKENRITSSEITQRLGIDGATIRVMIHDLRVKGNPIASDSKGYWIATDTEELNHTIAQLNSRIHEMIVVRESLKKTQSMMSEVAV